MNTSRKGYKFALSISNRIKKLGIDQYCRPTPRSGGTGTSFFEDSLRGDIKLRIVNGVGRRIECKNGYDGWFSKLMRGFWKQTTEQTPPNGSPILILKDYETPEEFVFMRLDDWINDLAELARLEELDNAK